jgi:hypothetical protein
MANPSGGRKTPVQTVLPAGSADWLVMIVRTRRRPDKSAFYVVLLLWAFFGNWKKEASCVPEKKRKNRSFRAPVGASRV